MKAIVDTNVLLVADRQHADISAECVIACVDRLVALKETGVVVIDDEYHLLEEYLHKIDVTRGKQAGAVFLKWLINNKTNPQHVEQVHITQTGENRFNEFPADPALKDFDPSDRKFVAVANAYPDQDKKPPIWQAADSKWLDWWPALQKHKIRVDFLNECREDIRRFYRQKFPEKDIPKFP